MAGRNLYQNFNTADVHVIDPDADGRGVYTKIHLVRLLVNGGTNGTITLVASDDSTSSGDDTRIGILTVPSGFTPFSMEFGVVVDGQLLLNASAATDITAVYELLP